MEPGTPEGLGSETPEQSKFTLLELQRMVEEHLADTYMGAALSQVSLTVDSEGFLEDHVIENLRKFFKVALEMTPSAKMQSKLEKMLDILGRPSPES